jgi:hypothetical protein
MSIEHNDDPRHCTECNGPAYEVSLAGLADGTRAYNCEECGCVFTVRDLQVMDATEAFEIMRRMA